MLKQINQNTASVHLTFKLANCLDELKEKTSRRGSYWPLISYVPHVDITTDKQEGRKIPESPWGSPIPIGDGDGDVNRFPDGDGDGDGDEAEKQGWGW
ncbi:hypothetical protein Tco_1445550 [Tanacetum coccineum]